MSIVTLATENSVAEVSLTGGEIKKWQCAGKDLLWTPDEAFWIRTCPILFPVVGWLRDDRVLIEGRCYPMTVHGFVKTSEFDVVETSRESLIIELRQSDDLAEIYPFSFRLRLKYDLSDNALSVDIEIANVGDVAMPYGVGLHPGFCWPLPGSSGRLHSIVFSSKESNLVPVVSEERYICRQTKALPFDGSTLELRESLFEKDALCFLNANSSTVTFSDNEGQAIMISSTNFPHWGIWSKPGANFLCIQSWTSYSDPPDFTGSMFEKPSMIILPGGETKSHSVRWEFTHAI